MYEFEQDGDRWGVTFFRTSSYLPYHEVLGLVEEATVMCLNKEDEREVENGDYRARLYTRREYDSIGSFGGIVFYAELETIKGKDSMRFVVSERTPSRRLPVFSKS